MSRLVGLYVVIFDLAGGLIVWPDYMWSSLTLWWIGRLARL